jgi:toxin ParE1/3/4
MTAKYVLSEPARNDLKHIWTYIAEYDTNTANKFLKDFAGKFKLLAANPKIGRTHDNLILNLRSFPFKNYVIFYFTRENSIEIYRVLHGARDIESLFDEFFEGLKP